MPLAGFRPYAKEDAEKYTKYRWWPGITFGDMLDKAADLYPNKEALVDSVSRLTYSQVREKANRLAIALMDLGIKPQQRVLLQCPNWNEFVYNYLYKFKSRLYVYFYFICSIINFVIYFKRCYYG